MEDARVVAGLVLADLGFFFEDGDGRAGEAFEDLVGNGETDNATADDADAARGRKIHVLLSLISKEDMAEVDRACELCRRVGAPLTRHHLLPQSRHNKPRFQRQFTKEDGKTRIAMLCKACHSCVHSVLSEKELEQGYNTLEALAGHTEVAKFVAWVAGKPAGFQPLSPRRKKKLV